MEQPRIGVWICDCKGLISDHLDTGLVAERAGDLAGVVTVRRADTLCTRADLQRLESEARQATVDRLLFAGCSARSSLKFPEEQLTGILRRLGIDKAFLEIANLREQCAWLHDDAGAATGKAVDLVRMAHARLAGAVASAGCVAVSRRALVVGGGPAGLAAAKALAAAGQQADIVERQPYLGGRLCQIGFLFQCESWPAYCWHECVGPVQAKEALLSPEIDLLTQSEVLSIEKMGGSFCARIRRGAAFVDADRCISCGSCAEVCPEEWASEFEEGLFRRKAIDKDFERAVPDAFSVIDQACTRCGDCVPVCPTDAIDLEARPDILERSYGAVFLATGFEHLDPTTMDALSVRSPDVLTGLQMERVMIRSPLRRPSDGEAPERVTFVLCAGSRAGVGKSLDGVSYCSKTCCAVTVKQAERILAANPMTEVVILYYNDIRTHERALEAFYTRLRAMGVEFVNADVQAVELNGSGRPRVRMKLGGGETPDLDDAEVSDGRMVLESDIVVLAAAQTPRRSASPVLEQLGVQTDVHGFPREAQVRLFRPTESMVDRVYAVGAGVGPKIVQQAAEQGAAAAMKALPVLMSGEREAERYTSRVAAETCIRCRTCMTVCPHGAIRMTEEGAVSDPGFCQGCGFCAAACPTHAAQLLNFSDRQILDQAAVAFGSLAEGEPRIMALLCYWCSYAGTDLAGVKGISAPSNFRSIRIRCSSSVNSALVLEMLRCGVDGILVAGCPERSCHHGWGNYLSDRRIELMRRLLAELGLSQKRLRFEYIGVPQSQKFVDVVTAMDRDLRALGPNPVPTLVRS